jgi:uncharacterized protein YbjQ (UPF0145 family)
MILTTGPNVDGRPVVEYCGLVNGEAILGADIFKDFFAGIRDVVGGRSGAYEHSLRQARNTAIKEMMQAAQELGADAIIAVDNRLRIVGDQQRRQHADGSCQRYSGASGIRRSWPRHLVPKLNSQI